MIATKIVIGELPSCGDEHRLDPILGAQRPPDHLIVIHQRGPVPAFRPWRVGAAERLLADAAHVTSSPATILGANPVGAVRITLGASSTCSATASSIVVVTGGKSTP